MKDTNEKWLSVLVVLSLILVMAAMMPVQVLAYPLEQDDTEITSALDYLRSAQSDDGCIGSFGTSAWVVMGIAAAGEDPHEWKTAPGNPSIVDYLKNNAGSINPDVATDWERSILGIVAAGEDPTNFGGIDYVEGLKNLWDAENNQMDELNLLNDDFWNILALVAAGEDPNSEMIQGSAAYIKNNQRVDDGGWSLGVGGNSDVDDTGAAIMALIAAGESPDSEVIKNAVRGEDGDGYLRMEQDDNGGFAMSGDTVNSASTSWAVDAIVAVGQDPTSEDWTWDDNPVNVLLSFQDPNDGSFWWTADSKSAPAWMTSYAIPALVGKPYPVKLETVTTLVISGGVVAETVTAIAPGKNATLTIPAGTTALNATGNPLTQFSIALQAFLPAAHPSTVSLPAESEDYAKYTYNLTPDGATFNPPIDFNITFNPADLPAGTTPVIYVYENGKWKALPTTVVDNNNATAKISHFSVYTLFAESPPPSIVSFAPTSPVSDTEGATRTFNITVNQTVNVTWQINGTEMQTNESLTEAAYTNTSAVIGACNVSAIASNSNGTAMQTWLWTVTAPEPTPTPTPTPTSSTNKTIPGGENGTVEGPPESDTTVNVTASGNVTVTVAYYSDNPHPEAPKPANMVQKYIDISVDNAGNVSWPMYVEMHYTDGEIAGLDENTLALYHYKAGAWHRCSDTGVNVDENYVWANVKKNECSGSPFASGGSTTSSPVSVPEYNVVGRIALIGVLSVVLAVVAVTSRRRRNK
jgi:hypothetical protein